MFLTCSVECRDRTLKRFKELLLHEKTMKVRGGFVEEVTLKDEYARPVRIRRSDTISSKTAVKQGESSSSCTVS